MGREAAGDSLPCNEFLASIYADKAITHVGQPDSGP